MNFRIFRELFRYAQHSVKYNEFVDSIKEIDGYDDSLTSTGILYSIWIFCSSMQVGRLREMTGLSRAEFCRRYDIPNRTMENWEKGKTIPSDFVRQLLAFAVMSDLHAMPAR